MVGTIADHRLNEANAGRLTALSGTRPRIPQPFRSPSGRLGVARCTDPLRLVSRPLLQVPRLTQRQGSETSSRERLSNDGGGSPQKGSESTPLLTQRLRTPC